MDKYELYVLLDDVEELMQLVIEREFFADHTSHYEALTNQINQKINKIRESAEERD